MLRAILLSAAAKTLYATVAGAALTAVDHWISGHPAGTAGPILGAVVGALTSTVLHTTTPPSTGASS